VKAGADQNEVFDLVLSLEMKRVIEQLSRQAGSSPEQMLKMAIALLKTVKDAETRGESPVLVDREGKITARLVGL
jgi:hypothetical protein